MDGKRIDDTDCKGGLAAAVQPTAQRSVPELHADLNDAKSVCAGCASLSIRVQQLETLLSQLAAQQAATMATAAAPLGTTTCYWIVVGLHGFLLMCLLTGTAAMFAYPFLLGAVGTLAACHALPVRPVLMKWLRSLLSVAVVCSCALLPLQMLGAFNAEFGTIVLVFLPLVLAPALVGAQLPAWVVGWRVLPPGTPRSTKVRFGIVDILGVTVIAALYAMLFQFANFDEFDLDLEDGGWLYVGLIPVACFIVGMVAAMSARGLLATGPRVSKRWLVYACLTVVLTTIVFVGAFVLQSTEFESEFNALLFSLLVYVSGACLACLACLASPIFTFLLMRVAGYRFAPFSRSCDTEATSA